MSARAAYVDGDNRAARCEGCHTVLLDLGDHTPDDLQTATDRHRCTDAGLVAAAWNDTHPIGTKIRHWPGFRVGAGVASRTRSRAWEVCGSAVVSVDGWAGGIWLDHIELVKEAEHV